MALRKRKIIMKALIISPLSYCLLLWIFHYKRLSWNQMHYMRPFRIRYGNRTFSFNKPLEKNNSVWTRDKNLEALPIEMRKISNNTSPATFSGLFAQRATPYNLCNPASCKIQKIYLVYNGTETLSYLGPKKWSIVHNMKWNILYYLVISKINKGNLPNCPCRLCKNICIK